MRQIIGLLFIVINTKNINMKKSILFFVIINTVLFYSQTVRINVNSVIDNKISLTISSTKKIILDDKLLYANDWIYQVNTLGIAKIN